MSQINLPPISIHIVTQNHMDHLPDLLCSLFSQTIQDFSIRIIDNGSTDGLETFLRLHYPKVTLLRHVRNLGFARAHNQGICFILEKIPQPLWQDQFVLFLSPFMILTPTCLEELFRVAKKYSEVGSFGGKIFRAYSENDQDEIFRNLVCSDYLDSAGFMKDKAGAWYLRGSGQMDEGQYEQTETIFAFEESFFFCRLKALAQIQNKESFFDSKFSTGLFGIDLCLRMQKRGWTCLYTPLAKAYHYVGHFRKEKKNKKVFCSLALIKKNFTIREMGRLIFWHFRWFCSCFFFRK
jgi:GT2 family glycosyltransferase